MYLNHCDKLMCQTWYMYDKCQFERTKKLWSERKVMSKTYKLTLRSKINVVSGSWMYATCCVMVTDACTKNELPVPEQTEVMGWTRRRGKHPTNFNLQVKGHCLIWIMNVRNTLSHGIAVIHPCVKLVKNIIDI